MVEVFVVMLVSILITVAIARFCPFVVATAITNRVA